MTTQKAGADLVGFGAHLLCVWCSNGAAISPVGVDLVGGVFVLLVGM